MPHSIPHKPQYSNQFSLAAQCFPCRFLFIPQYKHDTTTDTTKAPISLVLFTIWVTEFDHLFPAFSHVYYGFISLEVRLNPIADFTLSKNVALVSPVLTRFKLADYLLFGAASFLSNKIVSHKAMKCNGSFYFTQPVRPLSLIPLLWF